MPSLFDSRLTDPSTSDLAAERVRPARRALIDAIRAQFGEGMRLTQFEIATFVEQVYPGRWSEATIRSCCARAGLRAVDTKGTTPRGSRCIRFELGPRP